MTKLKLFLCAGILVYLNFRPRPLFASNFERTSLHYVNGPESPELNFKINLPEKFNIPPTSINFRYPYGVATDDDGNIYVPLRNRLIKVDSLGNKIWEYNVEPQSSWAVSTPVIYEGKLYFIGSFNTYYLFCLDLDGNSIWKEKLNRESSSSLFLASPVIVDDTIYAISSYPLKVVAFNKDAGSFVGERFYPTYSAMNNFGQVSLTASKNIIVPTADGKIAALNLKTMFRDDIDNTNLNRLLMYSQNFSNSNLASPLTSAALNLSNDSKSYVLISNLGGGVPAKLMQLNEVLQKDWEAAIGGFSYGNTAINRFGGVNVDVSLYPPQDSNVIYSFSLRGDKNWEFSYPKHDTFPNIVVSSNDLLYATGGHKVFALSVLGGEKVWEFETEASVSASPVLDSAGNLLIVDSLGNLYSFKGAGAEERCLRNFYCQGTPKHRPIVFIHGLGGKPDDWITGNKKEMRDLILEEYREDDPNYPESWAYAYNYGYDFNGKYNYEGDVRQIAQGLLETVSRLSRESLEAGGDGKVDLVGFSLGGLIIRQYLANTVGETNRDDDNWEHRIDKAVLIGTPNKGSWIMSLDEGLKELPPYGPLIDAGLVSLFELGLTQSNPDQPLHAHSWAATEVTPNSNFLKNLDDENLLPDDIDYYIIGANMRYRRGGEIFGFSTRTEYMDAGDLVVEKESAEYLPREPKQVIMYDDTMDVKFQLAKLEGMWDVHIEIPSLETMKLFHTSLIRQQKVREDVVNLLIGN